MANIASSIFTRLQDLVVPNGGHNTASSLLNSSSALVSSLAARLPSYSGASNSGNSGSDGASNGTATRVIDSLSHITAPSCLICGAQERKAVEKCYRRMEAVLRLCRQPALGLKKSPPCILEILPELGRILDEIFKADPTVLQSTAPPFLYLSLFIGNLSAKCKQTLDLFKRKKTEVLSNPESQERRPLTMKALIFSHMLAELQAEFPATSGYRFIGSNYRITKHESSEFWRTSFGTHRTLVPWEEFRSKLASVHPLGVGIETHALKSTMDLTCNDHISNFEFDVFTRLFHPFQTLLKNWQLLAVTHPAYMAFLTYEEVKTRLQQFINKPGTYVFRLSITKLGQWAIGYVAPDGKIYQTIPQNKSLIQSLVDGSREKFYLYPNGRPKNVDLSHALQSAASEQRMQVSPEQYAIYCEMGTTFEMCKICDERNKNVRLEPCGHLLCRPCLSSWQESLVDGSTCPFCRGEIKGTETVVIDAFHPSSPRRRLSGGGAATIERVPQPVADHSRRGVTTTQTSSDDFMSFSPSPRTPTMNNSSSPSFKTKEYREVQRIPHFSPPKDPPPPVPPKKIQPLKIMSPLAPSPTSNGHSQAMMAQATAGPVLTSSLASGLNRVASLNGVGNQRVATGGLRMPGGILDARIPLSPTNSLSSATADDVRKSSSEPMPPTSPQGPRMTPN